jgi:hypothetical protein
MKSLVAGPAPYSGLLDACYPNSDALPTNDRFESNTSQMLWTPNQSPPSYSHVQAPSSPALASLLAFPVLTKLFFKG